MTWRDVIEGDKRFSVEQSDCIDFLRQLPDGSVHCCVTSPPYFNQRDYKIEGQIGLERCPEEYVSSLVATFRDLRRVLRGDGCLWLNIGDSYAASGRGGGGGSFQNDDVGRDISALNQRRKPPTGYKNKDLIGIPWMLAFALRDDGWYWRQRVTLCKVAPMPESVLDRCTFATEELFMFTKSAKYFYDQDAERVPLAEGSAARYEYDFGGEKNESLTEADKDGMGVRTRTVGKREPTPGRNLWNYWMWNPEPYHEAHFATFPTWLPRRIIRLGTSERGVCPACGSPWSRVVEKKRGGKTTAVGWGPGCKCDAGEPIPAIVLDPFSGAGTTVMVAVRLGRRGIGCDLNSEYVEMSRRRILNDIGTQKDEGVKGYELPLFPVVE